METKAAPDTVVTVQTAGGTPGTPAAGTGVGSSSNLPTIAERSGSVVRRKGTPKSPSKRGRQSFVARLSASLGLTAPAAPEPRQARITLEEMQKTMQHVRDLPLNRLTKYYRSKRLNMSKAILTLQEEQRSQFYSELVYYLMLIVVFMWVLLSLPIQYQNEQNAALTDLFYTTEFDGEVYHKTIEDVMVQDEMWSWVSGPLVHGLFDGGLRDNWQVGTVQFRQIRVQEEVCLHGNEVFQHPYCYPLFEDGVEETSPANGGSLIWSDAGSTLYRSLVFSPNLFIGALTFGSGGYLVDILPGNRSVAEDTINSLMDTYVTNSTRAVAVTGLFYNGPADMFSCMQAVFEYSGSRMIIVTAGMRTFQLNRAQSGTQFMRDNIHVIILMIFVIYYIGVEVSQLFNLGLRRYVKSFWNLLEIVHLSLLFAFVIMWWVYIHFSTNMWAQAQHCVKHNCFVDQAPVVSLYCQNMYTIASVSTLLSWFKVFKYLRLSSRLMFMWHTIGMAVWDIFAFLWIFLILFIGYTLAAHFAFGQQMEQFHSFGSSFMACFSMMLGSFDYNSLVTAAPGIGPVFFASFMFIVLLTTINMFVAILNEYYGKAASQSHRRKRLLREAAASVEAPTDSNAPEEGQVEYDLLSRALAQVRRMPLKIVTRHQESGLQEHDVAERQVPVVELQREALVYVVDADWLIAERARLMHKFRTAAKAVLCLNALRIWAPSAAMEAAMGKPSRPLWAVGHSSVLNVFSGAPQTKMASMRMLMPLSPKRSTSSINYDETLLVPERMYVPLKSDVVDAWRLIRNLRVGQSLVISGDSSGTEDGGIVLEVCSGDWLGRGGLDLPHEHGLHGSGSHARLCRVAVGGFVGMSEECKLPWAAWALFFVQSVGRIGLQKLRRLATCGPCRDRQRSQRGTTVMNETNVWKLLTVNSTAKEEDGANRWARFDELLREIRMYALRTGKIGPMELESTAMWETVRFMQRFESCLTPVPAREAQGYNYVPVPVDTSLIRLPASVLSLAELVAENCHEVWSTGRIQQGWKWGAKRDNNLKLHPDLIPYGELTEEAKQYDRDTSFETLKVIMALGYSITRKGSDDSKSFAGHQFGTACTVPGGTYEPKPVPVSGVIVPSYIMQLVELLAENTHEIWAASRLKQGWTFGATRDDDKKHHNCLVPYSFLTEQEKEFDRNTAMETIKLLLGLGFSIVPSTRAHRGSIQVRAIGHSEADESKP